MLVGGRLEGNFWLLRAWSSVWGRADSDSEESMTSEISEGTRSRNEHCIRFPTQSLNVWPGIIVGGQCELDAPIISWSAGSVGEVTIIGSLGIFDTTLSLTLTVGENKCDGLRGPMAEA